MSHGGFTWTMKGNSEIQRSVVLLREATVAAAVAFVTICHAVNLRMAPGLGAVKL